LREPTAAGRGVDVAGLTGVWAFVAAVVAARIRRIAVFILMFDSNLVSHGSLSGGGWEEGGRDQGSAASAREIEAVPYESLSVQKIE